MSGLAKQAILVAGVTTVLLTPVLANDTTAAIGLGGIVPLKQDQIAMERENLLISPTEVQVHYLFRNHANQDMHSTVAFPLPKFSRFDERPEAWPNLKSGNLVDFAASVNDAPIQFKMETRAYIGSTDISQRLHDMGVPLGSGLRVQYATELKRGLAAAHLFNPEHDLPIWDEQTTFYWQQDFPAKATVTAEHHYRPAAGGQPVNDDLQTDDLCLGDLDKAEFRRLAAESRKADPRGNGYYAELATVSYILTTANNWRGPIGDFSLTINAPHPDILVSSCFPGLERRYPGSLTMHAIDFSPDRELTVFFIIPTSLFAPTEDPLAPARLKSTERLLADADKRAVATEELAGHTTSFLRLARNEIYARHGHRFQDPWLRAWFESKRWYRPDGHETSPSPIEQANAVAIEAEERRRTAPH